MQINTQPHSYTSQSTPSCLLLLLLLLLLPRLLLLAVIWFVCVVLVVWIVQDCDVYIGRDQHQGGWSLPESKWANPFKLKGEEERLNVIKQFEVYLMSRPDLLASLSELKGKSLGCWCTPKACHGDILVRMVNQLEDGMEQSAVEAMGVAAAAAPVKSSAAAPAAASSSSAAAAAPFVSPLRAALARRSAARTTPNEQKS